jgi:putative ABC transport system ATP-binding protein
MNILEARDISYKYKKKNDYVFEGLNLSFAAGRVSVLVGASGSGKTTLLSLLAGLDVCLDGKIFFHGKDLKEINRDKYRAVHVGMVFQQFNLLHRYNAVENLLVAMEISKYKSKDNKKYAEELLDNLGINETKRRRRVIELSGGEQQRVAIARAIAHQPKIILADEPTGSLDMAKQKEIVEDFVRFARSDDRCVIISTHSHEVAEYGDEIFTLNPR